MFKFNSVSLLRVSSDTGARAVWSASPPGSHDLVPSASPFVTRDASANRDKPGPMVKLDSTGPIELFNCGQILELSEWLKEAAMWLTACQMMQVQMGDSEEMLDVEVEFDDDEDDEDDEHI